jgi:hypothetical protein
MSALDASFWPRWSLKYQSTYVTIYRSQQCGMYSELFTVTCKSLHVDVPFIKKLIPRAASDSKKPVKAQQSAKPRDLGKRANRHGAHEEERHFEHATIRTVWLQSATVLRAHTHPSTESESTQSPWHRHDTPRPLKLHYQ